MPDTDVAALAEALPSDPLPDYGLVLVFERLPASEQALTVACLSRQWCGWAAPHAEALRVETPWLRVHHFAVPNYLWSQHLALWYPPL